MIVSLDAERPLSNQHPFMIKFCRDQKYRGFISHSEAQGTLQKIQWEECKSQKIWGRAVKCHPMGTTQPSNSWPHSNCRCPHWVCTITGPPVPTWLEPGVRGSNPHSWPIHFRQILGERAPLSSVVHPLLSPLGSNRSIGHHDHWDIDHWDISG